MGKIQANIGGVIKNLKPQANIGGVIKTAKKLQANISGVIKDIWKSSLYLYLDGQELFSLNYVWQDGKNGVDSGVVKNQSNIYMYAWTNGQEDPYYYSVHLSSSIGLDVTPYKTLYVEYYADTKGYYQMGIFQSKFGITSTANRENWLAYVMAPSNLTSTIISCDVSAISGLVYPRFTIKYNQIYITKIWLE